MTRGPGAPPRRTGAFAFLSEVDVAFTHGRALERLERLPDAYRQYERAVALNAANPRPKAALTNVALCLGRLDVAGPLFEHLRDVGYQPARAHYALGRMAELQGNLKRARAEYRRALAFELTLEAARSALQRVSGTPRAR